MIQTGHASKKHWPDSTRGVSSATRGHLACARLCSSTLQTQFWDAGSATAVRADMPAVLVSASTAVPSPTLFRLFSAFAAL